jgi:hypothetical protein
MTVSMRASRNRYLALNEPALHVARLSVALRERSQPSTWRVLDDDAKNHKTREV